jgi:hypothetical protein
MSKRLAAGVLGVASLLLARAADAGCGFYTNPLTASATALVNDADQVALVREGSRVALTMSTNYKGPLEDFAMVVPVPVVLHEAQVKTLSPEIFTHLEQLTAPRLVEYDERDPCAHTRDGAKGGAPGAMALGGGGGGSGGGAGLGGVKVEAQFIAGEYEIVVLSASESDALEKWLKEHQYKIPDGASAALAPYVAQQQKFVVAKVDSKKVKRDAHGAVVLSPLRFAYETTDFRLPVRLGLLNAPKGGKQDLVIYTLAKGKRMEAANLPNATIPTNVDLDEKAVSSFGAFYASLVDATLAKAGPAAVVTEFAWSASGCGFPCSGAPLAKDEIDKLGADTVFADADSGAVATGDLVLTRLHTRFDASTLKEDIVFRTADGLSGGRDGDPSADQETNATLGGANQFQARYAVRHPWKGDVACDQPIRGAWVPSAPHPAVDLAAVPRDVALASMVKSPVRALGLSMEAPKFAAPPTAPKLEPKKKTEGNLEEPVDRTMPIVMIAAGLGMLIALGLYARRKV